MPKKERPLPKPPTTPFGRKRSFGEEEGGAPLMADEMAVAMAEGKMEDFLKREMPDNEYARKLASMMMGMTGMLSPGELTTNIGEEPARPSDASAEGAAPREVPSAALPPEEVIRAVQAGDVEGLKGLLEREHRKRVPGHEETGEVGREKGEPGSALSSEEKQAMEMLTKIASENNLSMDWIVLRALKLYVQEYQRTGRL